MSNTERAKLSEDKLIERATQHTEQAASTYRRANPASHISMSARTVIHAAYKKGFRDAEASTTLTDLLSKHRIALTPEYEGCWHAQLFADQPAPIAEAEGDTPELAVEAVLQAAAEVRHE